MAIVVVLIDIAYLIYIASDKSLRTLVPVNAEGQPLEGGGEGPVVSLGSAVYVAGVGLALALIGLMITRQSVASPTRSPIAPAEQPIAPTAVQPEPRPTKVCPDCAESVLADARVCKHCGFRFNGASHAPASRVTPTQP